MVQQVTRRSRLGPMAAAVVALVLLVGGCADSPIGEDPESSSAAGEATLGGGGQETASSAEDTDSGGDSGGGGSGGGTDPKRSGPALARVGSPRRDHSDHSQSRSAPTCEAGQRTPRPASIVSVGR